MSLKFQTSSGTIGGSKAEKAAEEIGSCKLGVLLHTRQGEEPLRSHSHLLSSWPCFSSLSDVYMRYPLALGHLKILFYSSKGHEDHYSYFTQC